MRADPKPVVTAEMRMLTKAEVVRFDDRANAYAWSTPAGIASANISACLEYII